MKQVAEGQRGPLALGDSAEEPAGCYVYCVVPTQEEATMKVAGIQGQPVHTVVRDGLGAVVHSCPVHPYQSHDPEVVTTWALAQHQVVEESWRRWGTVLPLRFNTIIKADSQRSARENLTSWLEAEHPWLTAKLNDLEGKAEYGIQVFRDTEHLSRQVALASAEVQRLEEEIASRPRGVAYMHRQKLEAMLRKGIETRVAEEYQACYASISPWVETIHVEHPRPCQGMTQMLANLSCLVSAERYPGLAEELGRIGATEGFSLRLVGPLPPYSFC